MVRNRSVQRVPGGALVLGFAVLACGGGVEDEPVPESEFSMLDGETVLLLSVQYVRRDDGPLIGGARTERDAARSATDEIVFAFTEDPGRSTWIFPDAQVEALETRPMFEVNPYALAADEARDPDVKQIRGQLYSDVRPLVALFDARNILWPIEIYYQTDEGADVGHVVVRVLVIDGRSGMVLYKGIVKGDDHPATSPLAIASAAQALAREVGK